MSVEDLFLVHRDSRRRGPVRSPYFRDELRIILHDTIQRDTNFSNTIHDLENKNDVNLITNIF